MKFDVDSTFSGIKHVCLVSIVHSLSSTDESGQWWPEERAEESGPVGYLIDGNTAIEGDLVRGKSHTY